MALCSPCGKKVLRETGDGATCGDCKKVYHAKCQGLTGKDLEGYMILSPAQKKNWRCISCTAQRKVFMRDETRDCGISKSSPEIEELKTVFEARFDRLDNFMEKWQHIFGSISKDINDMREKNASLERRVTLLEKQSRHEEACDPNAIEIHGLRGIDEERKFDFVEEFLSESLKIALQPNDIDQCTLIKRKSDMKNNDNSAVKTGPKTVHDLLIVRLVSRRVSEMVLQSWREAQRHGKTTFDVLGVSNMRLRLNERMNRLTRDLLYKTRAAAKKKGWSYVWLKDGKVLIRKREKDKAFVIHSIDTLERIISE